MATIESQWILESYPQYNEFFEETVDSDTSAQNTLRREVKQVNRYKNICLHTDSDFDPTDALGDTDSGSGLVSYIASKPFNPLVLGVAARWVCIKDDYTPIGRGQDALRRTQTWEFRSAWVTYPWPV